MTIEQLRKLPDYDEIGPEQMDGEGRWLLPGGRMFDTQEEADRAVLADREGK